MPGSDHGTTTTRASRSRTAMTPVVFQVSSEFGAQTVDLAGDFSAWVPLPMDPAPGGGFRLGLQLESGCQWRYRFLLDQETWINDPDADDYMAGPTGGMASVVRT